MAPTPAKELSQARDHAKAGQAIMAALVRNHPGVTRWKKDLATFNKLAELEE